jgi:hypothetical protein
MSDTIPSEHKIPAWRECSCPDCRRAQSSFAAPTGLGHIVKEDEKWALLAGGNIHDLSESADWPIDQLAKRINMTRQKAIAFMQQNGWKLVRVQTQHKIVAVTQLLVSDVA